MENLIRAMTDLIASEVCGKPLDKSQYVFTDEELAELYKLSKNHDLAHLVGNALIKNDLIQNDEIKAKFQKQIMIAVYRYEKMNYELGRLRTALNKAQILFIPLKGSVLRQYYPEPWMRTSCDIDILVHDEQVDETAQVIVRKLGYNYEKKNYHDISLMSDSRVHLELHHSIKENKANIDVLLAEYRRYTVPFEGYEYQFTNEFFLFHQIAHASYHFLGGGCGIRPFLDIWVLNHRIDFDREKREKLLSDGGLDVFAKQAELLSEVWFGDAEHTEITRQMEEYILRGGVYGTTTNRVAVQQQKQGGKMKYALSKIFIPYDAIKFHYSILQKHKWLTPIMEVRRWGKLIFCGHLKRTVKELKYNSTISEDAAAEAKTLLKNVGL